MSADLEHQKEADRRISAIAAKLPYPEAPPIADQMPVIFEKIAAAEAASPSIRFFTPLRLVMAVFCVAVIIVLLRPTPMTLSTPPGQMLSKSLADGSQVELRAGSNLVLAGGFPEKNRDLKLEGEAFFRVKKGVHPFRIQAGETVITVLGTRFNVHARNHMVMVEVSEGRVRLSDTDGDFDMELVGGEKVQFISGAISEVMPFVSVDEPDWKRGVFKFHDASFAEVCRALERDFGITIELAPHLSNRKVNGRLKGDRPEVMIDALCTLMQAQWRQSGDTFSIKE